MVVTLLAIIFIGPTQEFGRDNRFALVRPYIRPYVRPDRFRSNGSIVFLIFGIKVAFYGS